MNEKIFVIQKFINNTESKINNISKLIKDIEDKEDIKSIDEDI